MIARSWLRSYNKTFGVKGFPVLGVVTAEDADDKDTIVYQLSTPTDVIIVVPQTGQVILTGNPLDMVAGSKMEFLVEAHDLRTPIRTSLQPAQIWLNVFKQPTDEEIYGKYMEKLANDLYQRESYYYLHRPCTSTNKAWFSCEHKKLKNTGMSENEIRNPKNTWMENSFHRIIKRRVTRAVRPTKRSTLR